MTKKYTTVRPNDLFIGMRVMSNTLGLNLDPSPFSVKEIGESVILNDGSKIVPVLLENSLGQGGWEDCWERDWAIGPLFFPSKPVACSANQLTEMKQ